eukprot:10512222-Heterocapsa_arctica.AAC.1
MDEADRMLDMAMCFSDPLDRVGSNCMTNDQMFERNRMVIARGLPHRPVPPKMFDVDVGSSS